MKVAHAINFVAEIDLDKVPASLLPALISLGEKELQEMCTGATLNAIQIANTLEIANEGNSWAEVKLA